MLLKEREFSPECVLFDSWYASLDNLKLVDPGNQRNRSISEVEEKGSLVHLKGYGWIKVFKFVSKEREIEYWASNDLNMNELKRLSLSEKGWMIEEYHRGIKQCARRSNFFLFIF